MHLLFSLLLITCGLLAAANFVIGKRPDARVVFDKVAPWSGLMGVVLLAIALLYLIKYVLPHLPTTLSTFYGLVALATIVVAILLGFLLGFGLLSAWFGGKSQEALAKGRELRAKLARVQIPLGFAGVALGVFGLV